MFLLHIFQIYLFETHVCKYVFYDPIRVTFKSQKYDQNNNIFHKGSNFPRK